MTTYTRDDALLERNEGSGPARIETSGVYVGRLTLARERIASTGTKGIEFNFESEDGRVARNMTLWIERANGERIDYFFGLLSSLMVCLGLDRVETSSSLVEEWNPESGRREAVQREVFADLADKPLGIVLQREESTWEGQPRVQMKPVGFFDPSDRSMAGEILDGSRSGKGLAKLESSLKERVVRQPAAPVDDFSSPPPRPAASARVDEGFVDDDIPF